LPLRRLTQSAMRIIAAYLLAVLGGNENPDEKTITKILAAVESKAEPDRIADLVNRLKGKDVNTLIEEGKAKIGSVASAAPSGGAAAGGGAAAAAGGGKPAGGKKVEEPKEEPKEEEEEEGGSMGGLFGDDE